MSYSPNSNNIATNTGSAIVGDTNTYTHFTPSAATVKGALQGIDAALSGSSFGSVTTVSVVSANGFAGTVSNPTTTPAITLSTTISGLLKGNGTAISAAISGTDYQAAGNYLTALTVDVAASGPGSVVATIQPNVVSNAKLAQMAAHTYKGNNTGLTANAIDITSTQLTADLNQFTSSLQGVVPGSGGGTSNFLRADGTWATPPNSGGTVTNVSVVTANGVSGSVSNPTTTPAITLTLGAITPSSVAATGIVTGSNLSGTNTGDVTLAPVGSSPNANAASLSGQVLTLQPFSSTQPGVVSASGGSSSSVLRGDGTWNTVSSTLGYTPENTANKGIANGYAGLDGSGKVPYAQLPSAIMTFKGAWNASTNSPTLADGTGTTGDTYRASVAGTQNLGSGSQTWAIGDFAIYNGTIWQHSPAADGVSSVNGFTGAVTLTQGNLTESTSSILTISGGTNAVWGSGTSIQVQQASGSASGYLSSTDWNTFNNKQPAGSYITALTGDVVASGPGSVSSTIQPNVVSNSKLAQMASHTYKGNNTGSTANVTDVTSTQLTADLNQFTSSLQGLVPGSGGGTSNFLRADGTWAIPPNSGGTVTSVSVVSANGLAGTVANATTTPAITLSTTITGVLQGNGTAISAASTTGSGSVVLATAPTLSNPVVGTQLQGDSSTKAASTSYVDTAVANAVAGVNPAVAVQAATTTASDTSSLTYNNGVSGIGATLTGATNTSITFDGFTFTAVGQRALVKNDTQSPSGAFNGVYYVTQIQTALLPPILTRALDYDQPSDINNTGSIPVLNGTVNNTTSWLLTTSVSSVGVDPLTYEKFTRNPADYLLKASNLSDVSSPSSAFNNISPMTTLGDTIYGGSSGAGTRLAGNTTSTKQFLTQTGTGSVSAAPAWGTIASADLPSISLTGDVTGSASGGSISTTIAANAVTNSKFRQSAGLSVVGNSGSSTANVADITGTANQVLVVNSAGTSLGFGAVNLSSSSAVTGNLPNSFLALMANNTVKANISGGSATPSDISAVSTATVSSFMVRDSNANVQINVITENFTTTATAAGTTTLTVSSAPLQQFTGTTTQTLVLPNATTLVNGWQFMVFNRSTGNVTVNANGGGLLQTMAGGSQATFTLASNGTSAGTWDVSYTTTSASNAITALTGDVSATGPGSVSATIGTNVVTNAKLAQAAANTVKGNNTGSTANVTDITLASAATASSVMYRDTNANTQANNFIDSVATTATAAGTTTLTVSSAALQQFTGTTTQTVVLPNATTLQNGTQYLVMNRSTGAVTVNFNGGSLAATVGANSQITFTLISNGTSAGTWDVFSVPSSFTGRSGSQSISNASSSQAVSFSSTLGTTSYGLTVSLRNTTDANPQFQPITITAKSATGFTASWNDPTDSANYFLEYIAVPNT